MLGLFPVFGRGRWWSIITRNLSTLFLATQKMFHLGMVLMVLGKCEGRLVVAKECGGMEISPFHTYAGATPMRHREGPKTPHHAVNTHGPSVASYPSPFWKAQNGTVHNLRKSQR